MNRRRIVPLVVGVVLVGVAIAYGRSLLKARAPEVAAAASGTVEATEASLGFALPGRITQIGPREGDSVKAGDTLARLDAVELGARRAQAQAQVSAARSLL